MRYAQIRDIDVTSGGDIGVSLFVQGCHFKCKNCFNQETWNFNGGKEWTEDTLNKFLILANKDYIKRISILGGEPLASENISDVYQLVTNIRLGLWGTKKIWLYTGYYWDEIFGYTDLSQDNITRQAIVELCDVLVDGRYEDDKKDLTLDFRGSSNQSVIDIQSKLHEQKYRE